MNKTQTQEPPPVVAKRRRGRPSGQTAANITVSVPVAVQQWLRSLPPGEAGRILAQAHKERLILADGSTPAH